MISPDLKEARRGGISAEQFDLSKFKLIAAAQLKQGAEHLARPLSKASKDRAQCDDLHLFGRETREGE
jgi:hypothetical protein